jgi:hypothetical protein
MVTVILQAVAKGGEAFCLLPLGNVRFSEFIAQNE